MTFAEYEVVGKRAYRDHQPGEIFEARLEGGAAGRAIRRGDIRFIRTVVPELQADSFEFPDGWLPSQIRS